LRLRQSPPLLSSHRPGLPLLALLSVSDKRGLVPFAAGLLELGFQLLSHGGLLGRPDLPSDRADMEANAIAPISVVAVNLYPFRQTVASGAGEEEVIE